MCLGVYANVFLYVYTLNTLLFQEEKEVLSPKSYEHREESPGDSFIFIPEDCVISKLVFLTFLSSSLLVWHGIYSCTICGFHFLFFQFDNLCFYSFSPHSFYNLSLQIRKPLIWNLCKSSIFQTYQLFLLQEFTTRVFQ